MIRIVKMGMSIDYHRLVLSFRHRYKGPIINLLIPLLYVQDYLLAIIQILGL